MVAGIAIPNFWLGLVLVALFAGTWKLFPPLGYVSLTADPMQNLRDMVLPVATLAVAQVAYVIHSARKALLP